MTQRAAGHRPVGGRRRRRWRAEGGSEGEREKLNERGPEAKLRRATTTKLLQLTSKWNYRLASPLLSPHGCWVPPSLTQCSVKLWCRRQRGLPAGEMERLIRTRRTSLFLFILLHVTTATQAGKVSVRSDIKRSVDRKSKFIWVSGLFIYLFIYLSFFNQAASFITWPPASTESLEQNDHL